MDRDDDRTLNEPADASPDVLAVHFGRSANCSSVGSVVDLLFVSSVVGSMVITAMAVLLEDGATSDDSDSDSADEIEDPPPDRQGPPP